MPRPDRIDPAATDLRWRDVPMDGANSDVYVVPLASHPDDRTLLTRFPAGFARPVPGFYAVAETFLVLDGTLLLDGAPLGPGTLTHVPAGALRTSLSTSDGALAIAWFSGPPEFIPGVTGADASPVLTVVPDAVPPGEVLSTPEARWQIVGAGESAGPGEYVELVRGRWSLHGDGAAGAAAGPLLRRQRCQA